jgi:hypothetical protein
VAPRGWGAHRSIGAPVHAAAPGATVSVQPGEYVERLVLDKPVVIRAEGGAGSVRLVGTGGPALILLAESGTVHGLTVESTGGAVAVLAERGAITVEGCEIRGLVRIGGDAAPVLLNLPGGRRRDRPGRHERRAAGQLYGHRRTRHRHPRTG